MPIVFRNALLVLTAALSSRTAKSCSSLCLYGCCDVPPTDPVCAADGSCGVTDRAPVSLGVRFSTNQPICITGIQFFHQSTFSNDFYFDAYLWNLQDEFNSLASAAVYGSGWLSAPLDPPIPMDPSDVFVASYTAPQGGYSFEYGYFASSRVVDSVTFPGPNLNGKYSYASNNTTFPFPGEGTFRNSSYSVTPLWVPAKKIFYYVWDPTSDTVAEELTDNAEICIPQPYNIEARRCQEPLTHPVQFKLSNATGVIHRQKEYETPYFLFGDTTNATFTDVFPSPSKKALAPGTYTLYTTFDGVTETIKFTQTC